MTALRRILGDLVETPGLASAAEPLAKASTSAPPEGRVMYAALRTLPMPEEPVARVWHAANMLREHRGDGHIAALVSERIGGTEAHVLSALAEAPYDGLEPLELDQLVALLEPISIRLEATGSK